MKRTIATVLLCIVLCLTAAGCGARPAPPPTDINDGTTSVTPPPAEPPLHNAGDEIPPAENTEGSQAQTPPVENTEGVQPEAPPADTQVATDTVLRCTASSLNVRKGAGTSYAVLGTLDKGDMVMPIRETNGWYEIWYLGGSAYASASYLTEVSFNKGGEAVERVIDEGKKLLGIPYEYGAQRYHFGNGSLNKNYDGKSYDCSSLMQYIFKIGADVNLAMTSREQSLQGKEVSRAEIRRGDLLFFTNASRLDKTGLERIGHVALYLGDNIILHTASDHAVIEPISDTRSSYFITARRVID